MAEKNCSDMAKLIFLIMCVTVVQWSRSCLHLQINRVRLPATLFSVSLYRFFFPVWSLFLTLFFLLAFISLFLLLTLPVMNLDQWYFKLKSGVLFWKRDFKSSLSPYWPSLRLDKNHKPCQDMSLLWNSWILTHSTPQTVLIYTHHPPVTHWRKLNLPFVHRLDHQHYHPKTSTGSATKK